VQYHDLQRDAALLRSVCLPPRSMPHRLTGSSVHLGGFEGLRRSNSGCAWVRGLTLSAAGSLPVSTRSSPSSRTVDLFWRPGFRGWCGSARSRARYEQGKTMPTVEKLEELLRAIAPDQKIVWHLAA